MKKKSYFKLAIIAILAIGITAVFTGCNKDYDDGVYDVTFSPQLYGEVVPWLNPNSSMKKGFAEFSHKYFEHVIRIWDVDDLWVVDIPITDEGSAGSGAYDYALNTGIYNAVVIPVLEDVAAVVESTTPYTMVDLDVGHAYDKAPFYTNSPVNFEVAGPTEVILNTKTDFGSFQFNNDGEHGALGTPIPEVLLIDDGAFLALHATSEQASYSQLQAVTPLAVLSTAAEVAQSEGSSVKDGMWFDTNNSADLYFLYMVPGNAGAISRSFHPVDANVDLGNPYPSYLAFDVAGGTGSTNPTLWMRDYYAAQEWIGNTTLRVVFDGEANMQVIQMDWFSNIISIGGVAAGTDMVVVAEQNATDSYMADITITNGTGPYVIEFFTDASRTIPAEVAGVDALFNETDEGTYTYGAFASETYYVTVTDAIPDEVFASVFLVNADITGITTSVSDYEITVTDVTYAGAGSYPAEFDPWTYELYPSLSDANAGTNMIATGNPMDAVTDGTYIVRTIDGAGQFNNTEVVVSIPINLAMTRVTMNGEGLTNPDYIEGLSVTGVPVGYTVDFVSANPTNLLVSDISGSTCTLTSITSPTSQTTLTVTVSKAGENDWVWSQLIAGNGIGDQMFVGGNPAFVEQ